MDSSKKISSPLIRTKNSSSSSSIFYAKKLVFNLNKRQILKLIVALMSINILISLLILRQRSGKITLIFDVYYNNNNGMSLQSKNINNDLLISLNTIRSIYDSNNIRKANLFKNQKTTHQILTSSSTITDLNSFNKNTFSNFNIKNNNLTIEWPKIVINNEKKCETKNNETIFIICMIHSHRNNYLRRQAMRDTWLNYTNVNDSQLNDNNNNDQNSTKINNLKLVHLFVIGNDEKNDIKTNSSNDIIKLESDTFNDIIMIDTEDTYQNLFYKHLTIINWIMKNCQHATYVIKLDDDVFVNIQKLSSHLIKKFNNNKTAKNSEKFIYCNVNDMALPMRKNDSKWYVDYDTYGFEYYPKYCEGFSYITNIETLRLMHAQSKIIPRFWIDDVYFTGILLYGLDQINWYDFKQESVKWSYYDFWDLGNTLNIYELYAAFLKLFNINAIDFYKMDYFVILHVQKEKQVNYNQLNSNNSYILSREFLKSINKNSTTTSNDLFNSNNNSLIVRNENINKCSYLNNKFKSLLSSFNINLTKDDCIGLEKKFYDFHFYKFCLKLWNQIKY